MNVAEAKNLLHGNASRNEFLLGGGYFTTGNVLKVASKVFTNALDILTVVEALQILRNESLALFRDRCNGVFTWGSRGPTWSSRSFYRSNRGFVCSNGIAFDDKSVSSENVL